MSRYERLKAVLAHIQRHPNAELRFERLTGFTMALIAIIGDDNAPIEINLDKEDAA